MEHDDLGLGERSLRHLRKGLADLDVLPVALLGATRALLGVHGVDLRDVVVGVDGGFDLRVLAPIARRLAFRVDREQAQDRDDLAPLVQLHRAVHLDHRPLGELGLLLLDRFETLVAVERVAGEHRSVPVDRAAGHEHVDAAERRAPQAVRRAVTLHRRVQDRRHRRRRDLRTPAGGEPVPDVVPQRVVVADRSCVVADRVRRRDGELLARAVRRLHPDERAAPRRCRGPEACTWWLLRTRVRYRSHQHPSIGSTRSRPAGTRRGWRRAHAPMSGSAWFSRWLRTKPHADARDGIGEPDLAARAHVPERLVVRAVLRGAGRERARGLAGVAEGPAARRPHDRVGSAHLLRAEARDRRARDELFAARPARRKRARGRARCRSRRSRRSPPRAPPGVFMNVGEARPAVRVGEQLTVRAGEHRLPGLATRGRASSADRADAPTVAASTRSPARLGRACGPPACRCGSRPRAAAATSVSKNVPRLTPVMRRTSSPTSQPNVRPW